MTLTYLVPRALDQDPNPRNGIWKRHGVNRVRSSWAAITEPRHLGSRAGGDLSHFSNDDRIGRSKTSQISSLWIHPQDGYLVAWVRQSDARLPNKLPVIGRPGFSCRRSALRIRTFVKPYHLKSSLCTATCLREGVVSSKIRKASIRSLEPPSKLFLLHVLQTQSAGMPTTTLDIVSSRVHPGTAI